MRSRRPRPRAIARTPASVLLSLASASCLLSRVHASVTLSQFQEISGFSTSCTNAYNTPLTNCQVSDFFPAKSSCIEACFEELQGITIAIKSACGGVTASSSTLIGLFLEGKGASVLCPNVVHDYGQGSAAASPSASSSAAPSPKSSSAAAATSSASSAPEISSETLTAIPTSTSSSVGVLPASPTSTDDGSNKVNATSSSQSHRSAPTGATSTSDPGTFGGGAIPFTDTGSASALSCRRFTCLVFSSAISTLLVTLFV